jgi:hypothetical protein
MGYDHPLLFQATHINIDITFPDQRQERKKAMKEEDSTAPAIAAEEGGTGGKKTRDDNPPVQKYRWTEEIKNLIWELVANSNDMASITNTMAYVCFPYAFVLSADARCLLVNGTRAWLLLVTKVSGRFYIKR